MTGFKPARLSLLLSSLAAPAFATTLVGLGADNDLHWLDADAWSRTGGVAVTGVDARLLGIDIRPAEGKLYGLYDDGTLAVIDHMTGQAQAVSTLAAMLPEGVAATVDFNPVAGKLRVMGSDGTSLRVTVETGEVVTDGSHAYATGDTAPNVIAGAYTNSVAGAEKTQLYAIDGAAGWLVLQDPPNDGVLNPVGELGATPAQAAFDIAPDGNRAWLVSGGAIHSVDLDSRGATAVARIEGVDLRDIAVLPGL